MKQAEIWQKRLILIIMVYWYNYLRKNWNVTIYYLRKQRIHLLLVCLACESAVWGYRGCSGVLENFHVPWTKKKLLRKVSLSALASLNISISVAHISAFVFLLRVVYRKAPKARDSAYSYKRYYIASNSDNLTDINDFMGQTVKFHFLCTKSWI